MQHLLGRVLADRGDVGGDGAGQHGVGCALEQLGGSALVVQRVQINAAGAGREGAQRIGAFLEAGAYGHGRVVIALGAAARRCGWGVLRPELVQAVGKEADEASAIWAVLAQVGAVPDRAQAAQ